MGDNLVQDFQMGPEGLDYFISLHRMIAGLGNELRVTKAHLQKAVEAARDLAGELDKAQENQGPPSAIAQALELQKQVKELERLRGRDRARLEELGRAHSEELQECQTRHVSELKAVMLDRDKAMSKARKVGEACATQNGYVAQLEREQADLKRVSDSRLAKIEELEAELVAQARRFSSSGRVML